MTSDPVVALADRPCTGAPVLFKFGTTASSIPAARDCLTGILGGLVSGDHLDDILVCASELLTNARAAARRYAKVMQFGWGRGDTPIRLGVLAGKCWTRLDVRDPEPYMQPTQRVDALVEGGRGLLIARSIGYLSETFAPRYKVVHLVVPVEGVSLTPAELAEALACQITEDPR